MRRALLVASGLGLSVLASIAFSDPPGEFAGKEADTVPARVAARTERTEVTATDADAELRTEYRKLMEEKAALQSQLDEARRVLFNLEAETQFNEALSILTRVSEEFPQSVASLKASRLLECWNAAAEQHLERPLAAISPPVAEDPTRPALIDFGEVIVNLDEGRLNRYLDIKIYLQVTAGELEAMTALVTANKIAMQDRLLSYLSRHKVEDMRASNHDRLRSEIREQFNAILFPDGSGDIDKVLFQKLAVQ